MLRSYLLAGAAASCLLLPVPASAQAQSADTSRSGTPASTEPARIWAGDIIVTGVRERFAATTSGAATRTDTPLIDVPQSVQVLTRTLIGEQDRRTLGDALVNVSGVVPTRSEEQLLIPPLVRGLPRRWPASC